MQRLKKGENTLNDTMLGHVSLCLCRNSYRIKALKSEPKINYGLSVILMCQFIHPWKQIYHSGK